MFAGGGTSTDISWKLKGVIIILGDDSSLLSIRHGSLKQLEGLNMFLLWLNALPGFRLVCIIPVLIGVLCAGPVRAEEVVRMSTGQWPPYTGVQEDGGGAVTQLVEAAFASQGISVDLSYSPWKRAYMLVKSGAQDGSYPWVWSQERAKDFYFSNPIMYSKFYFYHRADLDFDWDDLSDLKGLTVGLTRGSYMARMTSAADRYGFNISINDNDLSNFKLLLEGRIDVFPMDSVVAEHALAEHFPEAERKRIARHPNMYFQAPLSVVFHKSSEGGRELVKAFNAGLEKVRSQSSDLLSSMPLKVAFAHWPPWKIDDKGHFGGIDAEILREIGERTGVSFEFVSCPWKRCIALLERGDVDIITSFGATPSRRRFADFIEPPYAMEEVVVYKKKGSPIVVEDVTDLVGYRVGQISGSVYFSSYDQRDDLNKTSVAYESQLFKMLDNGRVDLVIGFESQMDYNIRLEGYRGSFEKCAIRHKSDNSYLALTKKSDMSAYKWLLRETLMEMVEDGTIQRIVSSYSGM